MGDNKNQQTAKPQIANTQQTGTYQFNYRSRMNADGSISLIPTDVNSLYDYILDLEFRIQKLEQAIKEASDDLRR